MVDATSPPGRQIATAGRRGKPPTVPLALSVRPFDAEAWRQYAVFCRGAVFAAHQSPIYLSAWAAEIGAEMISVAVGEPHKPQFVLVLEVLRRGLFRIARFPGGRHANGNFPATMPGFPSSEGAAAAIADLPAALHAARPDIDLLSLERIEPARDGWENPLVAIATGVSPNVSLAVDLSGGFEAVLGRTSGKRKMKKHRSQMRKFETAGGHRLIHAQTPAEVDVLLAAFFTMKARRFRSMGIRNVFARKEVQAFFRRLYREALEAPSPRFVLHGLEVGGTLRAVTGSSVLGDRMTCDFSSIREAGMASASPGDFLFFEDIREACDAGLAVFDFSVGDEPYKRLWCDIETWQRDVFLPLSGKGRALAFARQRLAAATGALKTNRRVWDLAKRVRRSVAGKRQAGPEDEDA